MEEVTVNKNCQICQNKIDIDVNLFVSCFNLNLLHKNCQEDWSGSSDPAEYKPCLLWL